MILLQAMSTNGTVLNGYQPGTSKVLLAVRARRVKTELRELLVTRVLPEIKVRRASMVPKERRVLTVLKVQRATKEIKDKRDKTVLKVKRETLGLRR